jgi:hypothetical protein
MTRLFGLTMDKANQIHARLISKGVIYGSLLICLSIVFNICGWLIVNQIIGILLVLAGIVFLSRPKFIFGVASLGMAKGAVGSGTATGEAEKFLKWYWDVAGHALLVVSLASLFLGTVSVSENPKAVPAILLSLMALGFMVWKWDTKFAFGKKFANFYAFSVLLLSLLAIVPRPLWIKFTGHDPRAVFAVSERDKAVSDVEKLQAQRAEKEVVEKLKAIEEKLKDGFGITNEEKTFLEKMQKERDARSLPAFSMKLVSSVQSSVAKREEKATELSEAHSVKVVMNDPNGFRIQGLQPGRYRLWAGESSRLQFVDGGRMMEVWPDGRTLDKITGGFEGHKEGYYDRMGTRSENPIPSAPTFALIAWVKGGAVAFQERGRSVEVEVGDTVIIDTNVPPAWRQSYKRNGGENTIYYQRRG